MALITSDIVLSRCCGSFVDEATGELSVKQWTRSYYNFDHIGQSLVSLFVVSTREGWTTIM